MFTTMGSVGEFESHWRKCDELKVKTTFFPVRPGKIVFPTQEYPQLKQFDLPRDDVSALARTGSKVNNRYILIDGCIDYVVYPNEVPHHQTRFVLEIDKRGPNDSFVLIDPANGTIQPQDVEIGINPTIGDDAD
jgi:hypothetical protein